MNGYNQCIKALAGSLGHQNYAAISFGALPKFKLIAATFFCPRFGSYVYFYFKGLKVLGSSSLPLWQFVPSRLSKSALSCAFVGKIGNSLLLGRVASLGREVELLVLGWPPLVVKLVPALWFSSENWSEIAVLSQVNHVFVVKYNNQFKRDSQRLAFLLLLQFSVYGTML
ncbi:hypothetical protein ACSBYH_004550 [Vibrio parahaemolyticus]